MKQKSYVNSYFVNKQFNGGISQSIALTIRDYRHSAILYDLDEAAMGKNFSSCLSDPARSFFLSNVKHGMTFSEIEYFMIAKYNSNSRQLQVRRKLEALKISSITAEKAISSKHHALTDAINTIDTLVPQCLPAFRADGHKISFLRQAVLQNSWSINPIVKVDAGGVSWRQFTTGLRAALSLHNEVDDSAHSPAHHSMQEDGVSQQTFFTRYGRDPRYIRKHEQHNQSLPNPKKLNNHPGNSRSRSEHQHDQNMTFAEAPRRSICFRCSKPWESGRQCEVRGVRELVYNRMKKGNHHTHIISELISIIENANNQREQYDGALPEANETHVVNSDIQEIESLLEGDVPNFDEEDAEFTTHFLSVAFNDDNYTFDDTKMSPNELNRIAAGREYTTELSRTYLSSESKKFSRPGFLIDIGHLSQLLD